MKTPYSLRPAALLALALFAGSIAGLAQGPKFSGGYFKANDGTNDIGLEFDSTGALTAYVGNQPFSRSSWEARADTLTIGPVTGPEGYTCPGSARYLWSIAENRLTLYVVTDDCQVRVQYFTGLVWTRG